MVVSSSTGTVVGMITGAPVVAAIQTVQSQWFNAMIFVCSVFREPEYVSEYWPRCLCNLCLFTFLNPPRN